MNHLDSLSQSDEEIARLKQAKNRLANAAARAATRSGGKSKKSDATVVPLKARRKKRKPSPEGCARIAEAVRKRWAAQKAKQKS